MIRIQHIYTYPLKSAAGATHHRHALQSIGLAGDRRWMLIDAEQRFVTGRMLPELVQLRARSEGDTLHLDPPGQPTLQARPLQDAAPLCVRIWKDLVQAQPVQAEVDAQLSRIYRRSLRLVYLGDPRARSLQPKGLDGHVSFADGYPLLLTSLSSLAALEQRVGRALDMRRFRPNLVIAGSAAWAEEGWSRVRIGALHFRVVNRCSRCVFTTVDPDTGLRDADREPLATLERERRFAEGACFGMNLVPEAPLPDAAEVVVGDSLQALALEQSL